MRWIIKIILFPISLVLSILTAFLTFLLGIRTAILYLLIMFCIFGAISSFMQKRSYHLNRSLDNDGIADRYDNDFRDSDYFESTYDVEDNLQSKEENAQKSNDKPSILSQIRAYQKESKTNENQTVKEQEFVR